MYRIPLLSSVLGLLILAAGVPAHAASFNCRQAVTPDEIAICSNPRLSQLDTEMGALWFAYEKIPMLMGASGARQDEARNFISVRRSCGADVGCLRHVYRARIRQLKNNIAQAASNVQP